MSASELAGVWRLVSFHDVDDTGTRQEGPLGSDPAGMLFYSADGHVSVTMMRTGDPGAAPAGLPRPAYMSYAGTWRRAGDQVIHTITVAPDPLWLGTDQVRDLLLDGDRLTLAGNSLIGRPQRRVLQWERIVAPC